MQPIRKIDACLLASVSFFSLAGCAGPNDYHLDPAQLTRSEFEAVLDLARQKALTSAAVESPHEAQLIKTTRPGWGYYFLAKPRAEYTFSWVVSSSETIVVRGRGNILVLEGATVTRLRPQRHARTN